MLVPCTGSRKRFVGSSEEGVGVCMCVCVTASVYVTMHYVNA